jgi:hypothetical protein
VEGSSEEGLTEHRIRRSNGPILFAEWDENLALRGWGYQPRVRPVRNSEQIIGLLRNRRGIVGDQKPSPFGFRNKVCSQSAKQGWLSRAGHIAASSLTKMNRLAPLGLSPYTDASVCPQLVRRQQMAGAQSIHTSEEVRKKALPREIPVAPNGTGVRSVGRESTTSTV